MLCDRYARRYTSTRLLSETNCIARLYMRRIGGLRAYRYEPRLPHRSIHFRVSRPLDNERRHQSPGCEILECSSRPRPMSSASSERGSAMREFQEWFSNIDWNAAGDKGSNWGFYMVEFSVQDS